LITLAHLSVFLRDEVLYRRLGERTSNQAAQIGNARLHDGLGEGGVDLPVLSVSMISAGVFFGAPMPAHALVSNLGTKSPTVGGCRAAPAGALQN